MLVSLEPLLALPSLLALAVVPSVLLPLGPPLALLSPLALVPLVPVPLYPLLVPNSSFS